MTALTPEEYLSQAIPADRRIRRKLDRLADLYADCTRSTAVLSLTPGGGHDGRAFENRMEKYLLLREEINADIDNYVGLKTEIQSVIDTLPDETWRYVLEKHFLQGKSYSEIGDEMGYHKNTIGKIAKKALANLKIPKLADES